MVIRVKARNGKSVSLSHLYWSWIRHIAAQEQVALPQSGTKTDALTEAEAKKLASALHSRAEKIRKGTAPRDATSFVRQAGEQWFSESKKGDTRALTADFDDPDGMDDTADFFDSSGGVILAY